MTLFDHLNNLTIYKKEADFDNDEFKSSYNKFMINRYVSMCELYIPLTAEINKFDIPDSAHYNYYLSALPQRKSFFNYIKKTKDLEKTEKEFICAYFECGKKECEEYIRILDETELEEIISIYRYGKNKMVQV